MIDRHETRLLHIRGGDLVSRFGLSRTQTVVLVSIAFVLVVQRAAFQILGTTPGGTSLLDALTLIANSLAVGCCFAASRRGQGVSRIFWLLFTSASTFELIGNAGRSEEHTSELQSLRHL